jgi:hypothetical protein
MMKTITAALAFMCFAGNAFAQTTPPPAAPATAAPASCANLVPPPPALDGATATAAQMAAGDQAYQAWRQQSTAAVECRRAQYNAAVDGMNTANTAWGATIAAYCARPNTHCQRTEQPATSAQTPATMP